MKTTTLILSGLASSATTLAQRCNDYVPNPPGTSACGYSYFEPEMGAACPSAGDFYASMGSAVREGKRCFAVPFTTPRWSVTINGFSLDESDVGPPTKFGACPNESDCDPANCQIVDTVIADNGRDWSVDCFETEADYNAIYIA